MADEWGIEDGYHDVAGQWHPTSDETRRRLRVAMGGHAEIADPPPRSRPVWIVRHGSSPSLQRPAELVLEDGSVVTATKALPADLPLGYHDLHPNDGGPVTRLIVAPDRCHVAPSMHTWGWAVQLYAARSNESWGIGDLADLRRIAEWTAAQGGGVVGVNPLHAPLPVGSQQPSPYYPSTRRYRSPLYLRVEEVPGWKFADPGLARTADRCKALSAVRKIDRDKVWELKLGALERVFGRFDNDPAFDAYLAREGDQLRRYATFCVLAEHHDTVWSEWPTEHRRPDNPGVERFAAANADRVLFHCWLQWQLDEQLAAAATASDTLLITDLAVGVDPAGADAWLWQDIFASGVRVGAPPDEFNPAGQDWGLPPMIPWKLRAEGYEPFAQVLRAAFRHAGGLRIDHAMGLVRLFWIPDGTTGEHGAYVRYPDSELLDILALESVRAGAIIVGEDLGTVEPGFREELAARGALSTRLVLFEDKSPDEFPEQAMAAITTHDLPTIAGLWSGTDADERRSIGVSADEAADAHMRSRVRDAAGVTDDAGARTVIVELHRQLAHAPSMIVTATLDDALGVEERPNIPGTVDERANWSIGLPKPLESIERDEGVQAVIAALGERRALD